MVDLVWLHHNTDTELADRVSHAAGRVYQRIGRDAFLAQLTDEPAFVKGWAQEILEYEGLDEKTDTPAR